MLSIAAMLIAVQEPPQRLPGLAHARQGQAMVRILRPAIIAFETGSVPFGDDKAELRQSAIRLSDGTRQPVKLLEFQ